MLHQHPLSFPKPFVILEPGDKHAHIHADTLTDLTLSSDLSSVRRSVLKLWEHGVCLIPRKQTQRVWFHFFLAGLVARLDLWRVPTHNAKCYFKADLYICIGFSQKCYNTHCCDGRPQQPGTVRDWFASWRYVSS